MFVKRAAASLLLLLSSLACNLDDADPSSAPTPRPSGEPGVVNLISDDEGADQDIPGAGVEYGKYAPGSR